MHLKLPVGKGVSRMIARTEIHKKIRISDDDRWISFSFDSEHVCNGVGTNMPYKKTEEDWDFYQKAIKRMLKELNE
jgi:hypothetical protein